MTVPAIETRGLRKVYGHTVGLESLDLRVEAGEVFGFLGPNGAGKTTAVKLLLGLTRPTAGEGSVLGRPIGDRPRAAGSATCPSSSATRSGSPAREVLDLHGQLAGLPGNEPDERDRPGAGRWSGLADRAGDRTGGFSKGMQQRLGLAPALLGDPAPGHPRRADLGARPGRSRRRARDHPGGARPRAPPCSSTRTCSARSSGCATGSPSSTTVASSRRARLAELLGESEVRIQVTNLPPGSLGQAALGAFGHLDYDDDWLTIRPSIPIGPRRRRDPSSVWGAGSTPSTPVAAQPRGPVPGHGPRRRRRPCRRPEGTAA